MSGYSIIVLMSKPIKLAIWHGVVAAVSFGFWFDVSRWLQAAAIEKDFVSYAVITFGFIVALVALGFMIFEKKWLVLSLPGMVALAYVANLGWSQLELIGLLILFLLAFKSYSDILRETRQRIKITLSEILRHGIFPFILGMFILLSFAAFQSPAFDRFENLKGLPPETQNYIKVIAENMVGHKIEGSEQEKKVIINQISAEVTREFNTALGPYFKYAPPVLAFTLFLILWSVSWIFIWLSVLAGMLIFFILKKTGFVRIEEKEVKAEVLNV